MSRPRGFIDNYRPQPQTMYLVHQVNEVLKEYNDYLPMTIRQIFYRLVATKGFSKTEKSYKRLAEVMNKARRSRLISFDNVRDDGYIGDFDMGYWFDSEELTNNFNSWVNAFKTSPQDFQDSYQVVWCEAKGMLPMLRKVADEFGVPVISSGGFDSVTAKYNLAKKFARMEKDIIIHHLGDHDPSGTHIFSSLDEDVSQFFDDLQSGDGFISFRRLAVTPDQIAEFNLETAPPKKTDKRSFSGETCQLEAIPPDILSELLEKNLEFNIDSHGTDEHLAFETVERGKLQALTDSKNL